MSFVQTCTTQCFRKTAAQSFFPPRGRGVGWGIELEKRTVLPGQDDYLPRGKEENMEKSCNGNKNICSHEVTH